MENQNHPPINNLTPAQQERLAILQEQLGVTQQAIGSIQRWGFARVDPSLGHGVQITNRKQLETGLAGVICATGFMTKNGDLVKGAIEAATTAQFEQLQPSLIHETAGATSG
jgi:hypothetical protein